MGSLLNRNSQQGWDNDSHSPFADGYGDNWYIINSFKYYNSFSYSYGERLKIKGKSDNKMAGAVV